MCQPQASNALDLAVVEYGSICYICGTESQKSEEIRSFELYEMLCCLNASSWFKHGRASVLRYVLEREERGNGMPAVPSVGWEIWNRKRNPDIFHGKKQHGKNSHGVSASKMWFHGKLMVKTYVKTPMLFPLPRCSLPNPFPISSQSIDRFEAAESEVPRSGDSWVVKDGSTRMRCGTDATAINGPNGARGAP